MIQYWLVGDSKWKPPSNLLPPSHNTYANPTEDAKISTGLLLWIIIKTFWSDVEIILPARQGRIRLFPAIAIWRPPSFTLRLRERERRTNLRAPRDIFSNNFPFLRSIVKFITCIKCVHTFHWRWCRLHNNLITYYRGTALFSSIHSRLQELCYSVPYTVPELYYSVPYTVLESSMLFSWLHSAVA